MKFDREAALAALTRGFTVSSAGAADMMSQPLKMTLAALLGVIQTVWDSQQVETSPAEAPGPLYPTTPSAVREAIRLITGRKVVIRGGWWELEGAHDVIGVPCAKATFSLLRHLNVIAPPPPREGTL